MKVTKKYTSKVSIKSSPKLDDIFRKSLNSSRGYIESIRQKFREADGVLRTQVEDTRGLLKRLNNTPKYVLNKKEADALAALDNVMPLPNAFLQSCGTKDLISFTICFCIVT